jgi:glycosyltransferase involved in cell wall biosynthesis
MNCALIIYPLSAGFRAGLERRLGGPVTYLSVQELRRAGAAAAVRRLRSLGAARLLLPIEDESSRATLGLLSSIAALAQARQVEIVGPDLAPVALSRWQVVPGLARVAVASAASALTAARTQARLAGLLRAPRVDAPLRSSGSTLYLNANLWFGVKAGGSVGHVAGVANELHERGLDVVFASAGGRGLVRPEVPMVALDPPAVFGLPYELNYYRFGRAAERQLRALPHRDWRFIYQRMSVGNFSGVQLSRRWGVPLVLEYNGSEVWIARNWGKPLRYERIASAAEEACLRHAHLVVTVSDVLRDELIERGVEPRRIVSYPNCIDPSTFDPAALTARASQLRRRHGIAADEVVVMFLGTFGQWHGAEVLARAIRRLADDRPQWLAQRRVRFVLVGDGLKMPEVRRTLDPAACGRFVLLPGLVPQSEAPAWLRLADVVVSPHVANADGSRFFGSPTKLFEYMAMGRPIVASDLDQIGEVLRNSLRTGRLPEGGPAGQARELAVLCPPGDERALSDGLEFLIDRPDWRRALGANARAEALARYTWAHHVSAVMDGLADVARGGTRDAR